MPKQHDLVKTTNLDNQVSHGSFASVVEDTQDEQVTFATPVRGPMEDRRRNDGMTSLHDILGNVNNNISMISGPFSSPLPGVAPQAWPSPWNEERGHPNYVFPVNDGSTQIHHILHIINSVFETLDDEQDDHSLLGNPNESPLAPQ